jgi:Flp pilus assembly protein TadD
MNNEIARLRDGIRLEPVNPARRAKLGEVLLRLGQYADAEILFRDCTRLDPDTTAYRESLGRALSALGRLADAEAAFSMAVQCEPGNPGFHAQLGWIRTRRGNYAGAETAFREALQIDSDNSSFQFGLGQVLADQAKYAEAETALLRASQLDPGNAYCHDALGAALAAQGRHADAEQSFRMAVELGAKVQSYHLHLGQALLEQELYDEAGAEFQAAIDLDPESAAARAGLGEVLVGQGRHDEARAEFQTAIDLDPASAAAHAGLGRARAGQAHYAEAEAAFRRAVQAESANPQHRLDLGRARAAQAHYAQAAEVFRQAVQDNPGNPQLHADLGRALLSQRNLGEAEQELRKALRLDPENPSFMADLGEVLLTRGQFPEAESLFRKAALRDPENPGHRAGLARALSGKGDYSAAEGLFRELAQDDHSSAQYRAGWGSVLSARGRHDEAQRLFREAMRLDAVNPEYGALLGRSLLLEGRHHDAEELFLQAAVLAPTNPAYQADLASALSATGQFPAAEDALLEAVLLDPSNPHYLADLGRVVGAQNRHAEAAAVLGLAVGRDPKNPIYRADLGRALHGQGCHAEAESVLREAMGLDPGNPAYLAECGRALLAQEKHAEAEDVLREAMGLDPGNPAYLAEYGRALLAQERYGEAEVICREAVGLDPGNPSYQARLGLVLLNRGELARAASILRKLQQSRPDMADPGTPDPGMADLCVAELQTAVSELCDKAIVSHACDMAEQLSDKHELQRLRIAWHEYKDHVAEIAESELSNLRAPYSDWSEARSSEETGLDNAHFPPRSYRIRIIGSLCLLAAALAAGGSLVTDSIPRLPSETRVIAEFLSLAAAVLGVAVPTIYFRRNRQGRPLPLRASLALEEQLASLITNLVLEPAKTAAIQVRWKDSAVDRVHVRDGDELSAKAEGTNLVATSAKIRLAKLLSEPHGAAVGLAGPPGSGKTELARAFTELRPAEPSSRKISLMLSTQVKCDAHTFLLTTLKELCLEIRAIVSAGSKDDRAAREHRRQRSSQIVIAGGLMGLGLTVVAATVAGVKISTVIPLLTGSILIIGGIMVLTAIRKPRLPRSRTDAPIRQTTAEQANELLTRLEFADSYSRNEMVGISTYGLTASAAQGSQFARVPLNERDVVRELRGMVQRVAKDGWEVVIAIDELDKMQDAKEAVEFLDHIKVLFPMPDCSFIVSVSEDAWARFASRGLPLRDIFESSFVDVVRIEILTPAEARDFLKRRNSSITDAQALFCHCLAGGLPRDLIRAARLLARVASRARERDGTDPPLFDVLKILVREDLEEKLMASEIFTRAERGQAPITTPWLDVWPDESETENLLAAIFKPCGDPTPTAFSQGASGEAEAEASRKDYFEAYIAVLHTIRQAFRPGGPLARLGQKPPDGERLLEGFHCIASARWSLASDIANGWRLLHEARKKLGLTPLDAPRGPAQPGPSDPMRNNSVAGGTA